MEASMNLGKMSMARDNGCAVPAAIQGLDVLSRRRDWTKQDAGGIRTGPQGQGQWTANGGPAALLPGGWPCAETAKQKQGGSAVATWEPTFAVTASGLACWWPVCAFAKGR